MKNHFLFIVSLLVFTTTVNSSSQEINQYVQDHKHALEALDPEIVSVSVGSYIDKSYQQFPFAQYLFKFYQYACPARVGPLLKKYLHSREELQSFTRIESAKKGLIVGFLIAIGSCAARYYPSKKMEYLLGMLISAGIIAHQNHAIGTVPYYDFDLKKQENLFAYDNGHAWQRFGLTFNAASLSFFISQWAFYYAGLV